MSSPSEPLPAVQRQRGVPGALPPRVPRGRPAPRPHIIPINYFGRSTRLYIDMRLSTSPHRRRRCSARRAPCPLSAWSLPVGQIAEALDAAHATAVPRYVKPSYVLITDRASLRHGLRHRAHRGQNSVRSDDVGLHRWHNRLHRPSCFTNGADRHRVDVYAWVSAATAPHRPGRPSRAPRRGADVRHVHVDPRPSAAVLVSPTASTRSSPTAMAEDPATATPPPASSATRRARRSAHGTMPARRPHHRAAPSSRPEHPPPTWRPTTTDRPARITAATTAGLPDAPASSGVRAAVPGDAVASPTRQTTLPRHPLRRRAWRPPGSRPSSCCVAVVVLAAPAGASGRRSGTGPVGAPPARRGIGEQRNGAGGRLGADAGDLDR